MVQQCEHHNEMVAKVMAADRLWSVTKWLFGIVILCMIGLFTFQGVILTQIWDIKTAQAVLATKLDGMQRQVNGGHVVK